LSWLGIPFYLVGQFSFLGLLSLGFLFTGFSFCFWLWCAGFSDGYILIRWLCIVIVHYFNLSVHHGPKFLSCCWCFLFHVICSQLADLFAPDSATSLFSDIAELVGFSDSSLHQTDWLAILPGGILGDPQWFWDPGLTTFSSHCIVILHHDLMVFAP